MNIGAMRHRVTIQQVSESRDAHGGVVESWSTFAVVWANIAPISGREYLAVKQTQAEVTHRIRMRYLYGITPKMRILYGDRIFDINSISNLQERGHEMEIMATEAVS